MNFVTELRKSALYIKLNSSVKYGGAIDIDTLTRVLKAINISFQNYFDAEFRNVFQGKITQKVNDEIKELQSESKLLIVDLNFASFSAALAPNSITHSGNFLHIKEPLTYKKKLFTSYEKDVFYSDLNNTNTANKLEKKFSKEERVKIFKPLEETVFNPKGYTFYYGKSFSETNRFFKPLTESTEKKLLPELPKSAPSAAEHLYIQYISTDGEYDLFGLKPKINKVLAAEKLQKPVYPLQTNVIKHEDSIVHLKDTISAEVRFDEAEQLYLISYPELNINVWGENRKEADEAFHFTFISLVKTIYKEKDANLTKSALELKSKLAHLINENKI